MVCPRFALPFGGALVLVLVFALDFAAGGAALAPQAATPGMPLPQSLAPRLEQGRGQTAAGAQPQGGGRGAPLGVAREPLGDGPWIVDTAEQHKVRVVMLASGLSNPWSLVFLPDGSMLLTERPGRLRIVRNGALDPQPVGGVPQVSATRLCGLMELALHPGFAENRLVYFTYTKPGENGLMATTLARGRFDGRALTGVEDLLVATPYWDCRGGAASRLAFGPDGLLYMTTGTSGEQREEAQDTTHYRGKVLRLTDDGTAAAGNPYVGRAGFRPEIYSYGHRNQLGLAFHPQTGELWNAEQGPNGGDELNIIRPGRNYGWPLVSLGRDYTGPWQGVFASDGMEPAAVNWVPSIAVAGLIFYDGDRFPAWRGNALVGAMRFGEIPNTGHMQRVVFNANGEEIRREMLLTELRQRIRDVRQGPDGYVYLLTDETPGPNNRVGGALLRLEPAP